LSHDGIALSCWSRRFDCNTASLHQAMRSIVYLSLFVAWWFAAIGAFRSSLLFLLLDVVPSQVCFGRLLCFLIVGIEASGISIPLSLLMLLGWSLIWIAFLTLRVYQWGSRSINLTNETGRLPIWKEVKFIGRIPRWYTRRVKEAIHIRLHPNNINRDSGIEIPEASIPTIRKHNSRPITKRTCEGTTSNSRNNNEDRNAPLAANHHATNSERKRSTSSPNED